MKKILITGGAGFIGSHTADLLIQNDYQVIVLDNLSTGKVTHLNLFHPNIEFIQGDILDYALMQKLIARVDAVLHLAAIASVQLSIQDPVQSLKTNTQGFLHVLHAIAESKKPIRLVYASSASVYGTPFSLPCDDEWLDLSRSVLSPYALEKLSNETYANLYANLYGISSLGLRYFNVYGVRQDPHSPYSGVISKFMRAYHAKEPLMIFGDGEQSRDFISVQDVARANVLALENTFQGVLNIATGYAETINHLIQYIENMGHEIANRIYVDAVKGDIRESFGRTDQALKHLNFKYSIRLAEGIQQLMAQTKLGVKNAENA